MRESLEGILTISVDVPTTYVTYEAHQVINSAGYSRQHWLHVCQGYPTPKMRPLVPIKGNSIFSTFDELNVVEFPCACGCNETRLGLLDGIIVTFASPECVSRTFDRNGTTTEDAEVFWQMVELLMTPESAYMTADMPFQTVDQLVDLLKHRKQLHRGGMHRVLSRNQIAEVMDW
jgi:hypothetical protein